MPRARVSVHRHKHRKRVLKAAKGYVGARSRLYRTASETVLRAQRYSFRDRHTRKREFRKLWITRIGAACRERGFQYSRLIQGLSAAQVALDRKMLADIALTDAGAFDTLVDMAKKAIGR
jgi:large subunit ribosomal protein L20